MADSCGSGISSIVGREPDARALRRLSSPHEVTRYRHHRLRHRRSGGEPVSAAGRASHHSTSSRRPSRASAGGRFSAAADRACRYWMNSVLALPRACCGARIDRLYGENERGRTHHGHALRRPRPTLARPRHAARRPVRGAARRRCPRRRGADRHVQVERIDAERGLSNTTAGWPRTRSVRSDRSSPMARTRACARCWAMRYVATRCIPWGAIWCLADDPHGRFAQSISNSATAAPAKCAACCRSAPCRAMPRRRASSASTGACAPPMLDAECWRPASSRCVQPSFAVVAGCGRVARADDGRVRRGGAPAIAMW
jgi:hypothetical protein